MGGRAWLVAACLAAFVVSPALCGYKFSEERNAKIKAVLHDPALPSYLIGITTKDADVPRVVSELSDKNMVIMTDAEGQKFACKLPDPSASGGAEEAPPPEPEKTTEEILDAMGSACFYRVEGWWTYEFCYKKSVRQFHQERDEVMSDFVLGAYDEVASARMNQFKGPEPALDGLAAAGTPQRYHSQLYVNGTACDLTGKFRQTEVRFLCTADANNFISSIKEPATCNYVLTFYTPTLCNHDDYKVKVQKIEHIRCDAYAEPAEGAGAGLQGPGAEAAAGVGEGAGGVAGGGGVASGGDGAGEGAGATGGDVAGDVAGEGGSEEGAAGAEETDEAEEQEEQDEEEEQQEEYAGGGGEEEGEQREEEDVPSGRDEL